MNSLRPLGHALMLFSIGTGMITAGAHGVWLSDDAWWLPVLNYISGIAMGAGFTLARIGSHPPSPSPGSPGSPE